MRCLDREDGGGSCRGPAGCSASSSRSPASDLFSMLIRMPRYYAEIVNDRDSPRVIEWYGRMMNRPAVEETLAISLPQALSGQDAFDAAASLIQSPSGSRTGRGASSLHFRLPGHRPRHAPRMLRSLAPGQARAQRASME